MPPKLLELRIQTGILDPMRHATWLTNTLPTKESKLMTRSKPLYVGTGIALAVLFSIATSSLEAGWHHAPVQRTAHASSGGSSGGSSGHCHGGLVRGLLSSLHQHHWHGRYVYAAGHASSGGSSGGALLYRRAPRRLYYAPSTVVPTPAPSKEPTAAPEKPAAKPAASPKAASEKPAADPAGQASLDTSKATFDIQVPEDARVFVNDIATKTPGENRRYVSHGLKTGYRYTYRVRAEVIRNGKAIQETQTVKLQAGQTGLLNFATLSSSTSVVTTLILHVPEGATVSLAGKPLPTGNNVRTFQTTKLAAGETWTDYPIQVTYQENGQTKQRLRMITFKAGDTHKIELTVDSPRIANAP